MGGLVGAWLGISRCAYLDRRRNHQLSDPPPADDEEPTVAFESSAFGPVLAGLIVPAPPMSAALGLVTERVPDEVGMARHRARPRPKKHRSLGCFRYPDNPGA